MFLFGLAAVWTSVKSYQIAQREINDDLQQALTLTKAEAPADWFTTDTIRQFRSHIVSPELRQEAQLAFREKTGAILCKDIKGIESGVELCSCDDCVRNAVCVLEEIRKEN